MTTLSLCAANAKEGFNMTDDQFIRLAIVRKSQVKEWKAIPEAERPTWEQFKRGLKRKKIQK
tara:strand:+ start:371 stop:556 length:186 start_codon:yes stop_codon:yes gene_type:complete